MKDERQNPLASAVEAMVRASIAGWITGEAHSGEHLDKLADLANDINAAVAEVIDAGRGPALNCPGEWRAFALEQYGHVLAEIGRMFGEAGKNAQDAANTLTATALGMMQRAEANSKPTWH